MFDLSKLTIEFECPDCEFLNEVTLDDVRNEKVVICNGCLKEIHLQDGDNSTEDAVKKVNKSIDDLGKSLK